MDNDLFKYFSQIFSEWCDVSQLTIANLNDMRPMLPFLEYHKFDFIRVQLQRSVDVQLDIFKIQLLSWIFFTGMW